MFSGPQDYTKPPETPIPLESPRPALSSCAQARRVHCRNREKQSVDAGNSCGSRGGTRDAADELRSAAGDAGDARTTARPSRAHVAAALPRRLSRLGRRLTAPHCLAATCGGSSSSEKGTESSKKKLAAAEKAVATLPLMVVKLVVELAVLCSNESNMGASKVGAGAGAGRARQHAFQGQSQERRAPKRRGAAERAPEAVATAVPPCAKHVL